MIAYNRQSLDNRDIQQQANEALAAGIITASEYDRIKEAYPFKFYTPNVFIRGGLLLLTVLAVACGLGLFLLMGVGGGDRAFGFILIIWGLACYGALEFFIQVRGFYRAGVDDALLWLAGGLVFGGIFWLSDSLSPSIGSDIVFMLAAWGVLRYADRLMALVAYGAFINLIFHFFIGRGSFGVMTLPFIIMGVSVIIYLLFTNLCGKERLQHYRSCLLLLRMAALLSFYLSGNYYIVQNINASIHGDTAPIALGWLWWGFTVIVPLAYIVRGIQKKDVILLWTGLALVAGAVFTFRYYYHLLPTEWAMLAAGSILVAGAYVLIRYLHTPKFGFTSAAPAEPHLLEHLPIESLIVAETFQSVAAPPANQSNDFGGGSGGGGGASGTY
jgi:hypothetical protein